MDSSSQESTKLPTSSSSSYDCLEPNHRVCGRSTSLSSYASSPETREDFAEKPEKDDKNLKILQEAEERESEFLEFVKKLNVSGGVGVRSSESSKSLTRQGVNQNGPSSKSGYEALERLVKLMEDVIVLKNDNAGLKARNDETEKNLSRRGGQRHAISRSKSEDPKDRTSSIMRRRRKKSQTISTSSEIISTSINELPGCRASPPTAERLPSSSSSSSEDLPYELYDMNDDIRFPPLTKSSSMTQFRDSASSIQSGSNDTGGVLASSIQRCHSLASISDLKSGTPAQVSSREDLKKSSSNKTSTWGKVKEMISPRRGSLKKKNFTKSHSFESSPPRLIPPPSSEQSKTNAESPKSPRTSKNNDWTGGVPGRLFPHLSIASTNEPVHHHNQSSSSSTSFPIVHSIPFLENENSMKTGHLHRSKWTKVKKAFLTAPNRKEDEDSSQSLPTTPKRKLNYFFGDDAFIVEENDSIPESSTEDLKNEIRRNYAQLQRSISHEFQRKIQSWENQSSRRRVGGDIHPTSSSTLPALEVAGQVNNLTQDFIKKYDTWTKMKTDVGESDPSNSILYPSELDGQNIPPEFKRKLEAWEKLRGGRQEMETEKKIRARPLGQQKIRENDLKPEFKLKVAEWEVRKALAGHSSKNVEEIQKMMPEDFNRKLKEWEMIKKPPSPGQEGGSLTHLKHAQQRSSTSSSSHISPPPGPLVPKSQGGFSKKKKSNRDHKRRNGQYPDKAAYFESGEDRDTLWLEKELLKIQREKQRLEREKKKYLEREARLEKMRRAMEEPKEITVKTAKGEEFRFGGISEKFTRKLFEWEEQRGIAPESSTIALLDPHYSTKENQEPYTAARNEKDKSAMRRRSYKQAAHGALDSAGSSEIIHKDSLKKIRLSRSDSSCTQTNIQLLDKKISIIEDLRIRGLRCKELESALSNLNHRLEALEDSKKTINDVKGKNSTEMKKELSEWQDTETLLKNEQENVKHSLEEETMCHKRMTESLLKKIENFCQSSSAVEETRDPQSEDEMRDRSFSQDIESQIHLTSSSDSLHDMKKEDVEQFASGWTDNYGYLESSLILPMELKLVLRRIQCLSESLNKQTKALEQRMIAQHVYKDEACRSRTELKTVDVPNELHITIQELRNEMLAMLRLESIGRVKYVGDEDDEIELFCGSKGLGLNYSESEISFTGRYIESEEDESRLSYTNSISQYGSESPILGARNYRMSDIENDGANDEENALGALFRLKASRRNRDSFYRFVESDEESSNKIVVSDYKKLSNYRRKNTRRTSSDNISTPASGRSRSPSIVSSVYIPEEDENEEEEKCIGSVKEEEEEENKSNVDIDKVVQLVQNLREEDLRNHKRKLEEHLQRKEEMRRKSEEKEMEKQDMRSSPTSQIREETYLTTSDLVSVKLIQEAQHSLIRGISPHGEGPERGVYRGLADVVVPTTRKTLYYEDKSSENRAVNLQKLISTENKEDGEAMLSKGVEEILERMGEKSNLEFNEELTSHLSSRSHQIQSPLPKTPPEIIYPSLTVDDDPFLTAARKKAASRAKRIKKAREEFLFGASNISISSLTSSEESQRDAIEERVETPMEVLSFPEMSNDASARLEVPPPVHQNESLFTRLRRKGRFYSGKNEQEEVYNRRSLVEDTNNSASRPQINSSRSNEDILSSKIRSCPSSPGNSATRRKSYSWLTKNPFKISKS